MTFEIQNRNFTLNGRKIFLNSGEIHYFRVKKEFWEDHLKAAKEAGLTAVSTYIPWAWHEPEENYFDFNGHSIPERDLEGFINLCKKNGLYCILKPGPFILAEYRGAGLPDWLMDQSELIKMRNRNGKIFSSDGVSLFHPLYLEKVTAWYDKIMPIIRKNELANGGNVILMQICNEIGVFSWLAHQADYNQRTKVRFANYLKAKNNDIQYWNLLWDTNYNSFESIELPPDGQLPYQSINDRGRDYEWHLFWRRYYADYLIMLSGMARERGVSVPFYHNLPGWIYGNGYEFPVNITMYEELFQNCSEIIFGVDHIPEFMSYRNLHDDRIINDITFAMQGDKPLFAAEFQCGSREYHVVTNPTEMELFYKASIANGLTGWNYYMFSQGRNQEHKGYSGTTFYWFNPLTPEAKRTNMFPLVQRMSKLINVAENIIVQAQRKAEIAVLFYPPYYATELERPTDEKSKIIFNFTAIRRPAYFDGLLKALQVLNVEYDMLDLNIVSNIEINKYKQIWAFTTDEMNASAQQKILNYTENGGQTIMFPSMPVREMNGTPCTIIRDAVQINSEQVYSFDSPLLDILNHKDIKCANPQIIYNTDFSKDTDVIARNIHGKICGFKKPLQKGNFIHIGTWLGFDTEAHKNVYYDLLKLSNANLHNATATNENIIVRERFTKQQAILFIGNYYNQSHNTKIQYTHPETNETISIPYSGNHICMPALYAVLTPINLNIGFDIHLLHSTSDLLQINEKQQVIEITLIGNRDMQGEMLLDNKGLFNIESVESAEVQIKLEKKDVRLQINYRHLHHQEIKILIHIK